MYSFFQRHVLFLQSLLSDLRFLPDFPRCRPDLRLQGGERGYFSYILSVLMQVRKPCCDSPQAIFTRTIAFSTLQLDEIFWSAAPASVRSSSFCSGSRPGSVAFSGDGAPEDFSSFSRGVSVRRIRNQSRDSRRS